MMNSCCYNNDHDASMSVFCFIDTSLSKHVAMIIEFGICLRTSECLSLGELILLFCIMFSYYYL